MSREVPSERAIIDKPRDDFFIAGLDEVGRGPLAGPVVGGCAFLRWEKYSFSGLEAFLKHLKYLNVNDAKKLTSKNRQKILSYFHLHPRDLQAQKYFSLGNPWNFQLGVFLTEISPRRIDRINILNSSLEAMATSYEKCKKQNKGNKGMVLVDGNILPKKLKDPAMAIVKGDQKSLLIALASIFAKEYRDHLMKEMDKVYPLYHWARNKGYPTEEHIEALRTHGPCPLHRRSFRGVISDQKIFTG
jgi:ribonuclease HII